MLLPSCECPGWIGALPAAWTDGFGRWKWQILGTTIGWCRAIGRQQYGLDVHPVGGVVQHLAVLFYFYSSTLSPGGARHPVC